MAEQHGAGVVRETTVSRVSVEIEYGGEHHVAILPDDVPARLIIRELAEVLDLASQDLCLVVSGRTIPVDETLFEAGIADGESVEIRLVPRSTRASISIAQATPVVERGTSKIELKGHHPKLPQPRPGIDL